MKHSVNISLCKSESDLKPVRIRVSFAGSRLDLRPNVSYNESKWNTATQRAKNNTFNDNRQSASEINKILSTALEFIDGYFQRCELSGEQPDAKVLKDAFNAEFQQKTAEKLSIDHYIDMFIAEKSLEKSWAENTLKKYKHLKRMLADYEISSICEDTLHRYVKAEIEAGKRNPTIQKNFNVLKVFGNWLYKHGYTEYDINTFELHLKGTERTKKAVIYLNWDELMQLWNFDFSRNPSLGMVRDAFCFCCFCGLRFSDAKNLKKADVQNGKINTTTIKTYDDLAIELNKYTTEVLERYKDMESESALYMISNQKNNEYIKEACRMAGLDRPIKKTFFVGSERKEITKPLWQWVSSHAARRTFVVQCIRRRIPIPVIMQWTGHSNYEAMKPYIDAVSELKEEEMQKFNE